MLGRCASCGDLARTVAIAAAGRVRGILREEEGIDRWFLFPFRPLPLTPTSRSPGVWNNVSGLGLGLGLGLGSDLMCIE